MAGLEFYERMVVRPLLMAKLAELSENAFEAFFQRVMTTRYPDFVEVRTAGSLGDIASDGLTLHSRKLFACYGPTVYDRDRVEAKFWDDLGKSKSKRHGEFDTFVFVHNELRGVHPTISQVLAKARDENPEIKFEVFGATRFRGELCSMSRDQVEDLLGTQLPIDKMTTPLAPEELVPLLTHLRESRRPAPDDPEISVPSRRKLAYNSFSDDQRDELRAEFKYSKYIDVYYADRTDVTEKDEVAASFTDEYLRLVEERQDADDVVLGLRQFVLGNESAPVVAHRSAIAIIGYFLQSCDIFENPPTDWVELGA